MISILFGLEDCNKALSVKTPVRYIKLINNVKKILSRTSEKAVEYTKDAGQQLKPRLKAAVRDP
jgi:hypothetical protein